MGFYFFALAFLGGWRRRWGWIAAGLAALFGLLIGCARIAQGGHFLSDVWWSAGFCLLTSAVAYYALGLQKSLWSPQIADRRLPLWVSLSGGVTAAAIIAAVLLATPYRKIHPSLELAMEEPSFRFSLTVTGDFHRFTLSPEVTSILIEAKGQGHGMPGSAVKTRLDPIHLGYLYRQRVSGWFNELSHRNNITIPADYPGNVELRVERGLVEIDASLLAVAQQWTIIFSHEGGTVRVRDAPQGMLRLSVQGGSVEEWDAL
ncbi:MAG: hypothetical protein AAF191_19480, partial [Verrucomicrobiota bacterium]